jgi:DNA-binding XRE family transcriptional regulator
MRNKAEERRQAPAMTALINRHTHTDSTMHTAQTIAQRLRDRRRACGLTQVQLAQQSGVPMDELPAIEFGQDSTPYYTSVALLARVLGVEPRWLYYGDNRPPTES